MPSISVEVDVELHEIDTNDLVSEIISRMKSVVQYRKPSVREVEELKKQYSELAKELKFEYIKEIETKKLIDVMKYEYFKEIFNRYSLEEIEKRLPKY